MRSESRSVGQEIPRPLQNRKVRYRVHKSLVSNKILTFISTVECEEARILGYGPVR
jgi:hypothetical protein